ncbi:MAG TPA: cytochrome c biogenesis protein ResB [Candidatus Nanopelagicales bacterium]
MTAGPTVPPRAAGDAEGVDLAAGLPDGSGLETDPRTLDPTQRHDGLPADAVVLGSDWGSSRKRRTTGMGPRLGPVGWLRWAWRQLTSMRTALVLLFLLAVAAIPGSVLPQRGTDPLAVNAWLADNAGLGPTLDRFGFFEVFTAPWFSAIYILLFISLIGCVLPRIGAHWRAMRQPTPPAPRRLTRLAGASTWQTDDPSVLATATATLLGQRWRVTPGPDGEGPTGSMAAEKGFARETGNLLFHIALVLILIGVALGALFGWKGTVIVREGSGFSDTLTQYDSFAPGRLADAEDLPPFSFTLTDFEATFEREGSQRGAPRSFSATLDYTGEPGASRQTKVVSVNEPLTLDGAKVFLVGHGYAPHLRLRDSTGTVVFDDTVVFLPQDGSFTSTGVLKAPDATPQLGITAIFAPTAVVDQHLGPHSVFPAPDNPGLFASAFTGDLGLDTGMPSNVFELDTAGLEQVGLEGLVPGQTWQLPDGAGSLEFVAVERWASFTISHDPGKGLALAGAVLAIVGLMLSLFVKRRRIWVRVDEVPARPAPAAPAADAPTSAEVPAPTAASPTSAEVPASPDGAPTSAGTPASPDGAPTPENPRAGTDAARPHGGSVPPWRASGGAATVYRVQVGGLSRTESADVIGEVQQLVARLGGPVTEEQS